MRTLERFGLITGMCAGICLGACSGGDGAPDAAPIDAQPPDAVVPDAMPIPDASQNPLSLRETGLYWDFDAEALAPGVREFEPRFPLWSDGAEKRRFMYLPPGQQIDTSDMDYWEYPVGTRLWKEFWRDGVRLETRLLYKIRGGVGPGSWRMVAFAWNQDQSEAVAVLSGVEDALDTEHDIPPQVECLQCHGRGRDIGLGLSAVMLDHDGAGVTLSDLIAEGDLSHPPAGTGSPYFPLPGDAAEQSALGYLHANCGSCHNPESEITDEVDMNLRLLVNEIATVEGSPAFTTTVCQEMQKMISGAEAIVVPGQPDVSAMFMRMNQRNTLDQMPAVASELVDATGLAAIRAWILSIDACPP